MSSTPSRVSTVNAPPMYRARIVSTLRNSGQNSLRAPFCALVRVTWIRRLVAMSDLVLVESDGEAVVGRKRDQRLDALKLRDAGDGAVEQIKHDGVRVLAVEP